MDEHLGTPLQHVATVEAAFAAFAGHILDIVEPGGWDQPAVLWAVHARDTTDGEFTLTLDFAHLHDLEGVPAEALAGVHAPPEALAVAVSCEGWMYHPDRLTDVAPVGPPSMCTDSIEVRLVHLVARDGTEVLTQRPRTPLDLPEVLYGRQHGRLPESLRRTIGLPSCAPDPTISVSEARARILPAVVRAGIFAMAPAGPDAVAWALDELERRGGSLRAAASRQFGLGECTWDAALAAAERSSLGAAPDAVMPYGEELRRLLGWADGPIWGTAVAETLPPRVDVVLSLEHLRLAGILSSEQFRRAVWILDAAPT